jgi:hypothetical protein
MFKTINSIDAYQQIYLSEIITITDLDLDASIGVLHGTCSFISFPVHSWEGAFDAHWTRGWMGPRTGLAVEDEIKILYLSGIELRPPTSLSATFVKETNS